MADMLELDQPIVSYEPLDDGPDGTLVIRIPTAVEALSLMTHLHFRWAVRDAIEEMMDSWNRWRPGTQATEVKYLRWRYQQGWTVAQIRRELGFNSYQMSMIAAAAHWWVWEQLHHSAPELAATFGHFEQD